MVAYLRCFSTESKGDRFPCARDRAFEAKVWQALERLPACTENTLGPSSLAARLEVRRGKPAQVELSLAHSVRRTTRQELRAVTKCAEPELRELRAPAVGPHFIALFRFEQRE